MYREREAQIPVPESIVETVALGTRLRPDFPRGFVTVYDRGDATVQFQYCATPISVVCGNSAVGSVDLRTLSVALLPCP